MRHSEQLLVWRDLSEVVLFAQFCSLSGTRVRVRESSLRTQFLPEMLYVDLRFPLQHAAAMLPLKKDG